MSHALAPPPSAATILHADLDAFYASVEQVRDPSLRGRPVIVGGGVVLAASYEAKRHGITAGMSGRRAQQLCPTAVFVAPDLARYGEVSKQVMSIFHAFTPIVEPLSPDEAFLDVAGARRVLGSATAIAQSLRARVRAETGLAVSVGVARTKFLAKVASAAAKPDGLLVVDREHELPFLAALPIGALYGAGPKTVERLRSIGVLTVAEALELPDDVLSAQLGAHLSAAPAPRRIPRRRGAGRDASPLAARRDPPARPVDRQPASHATHLRPRHACGRARAAFRPGVRSRPGGAARRTHRDVAPALRRRAADNP